LRGLAWYGEARVTLSPRVFVAGRFERNRYAFIRPAGTSWISTDRTQLNGEVGVGYRLGPGTLIKASYRRDYWPGETAPGALAFPDGYAVALQFSHWLDVGGLFAGRE
jgi:outer membrane receptor protein involved in Fe transport